MQPDNHQLYWSLAEAQQHTGLTPQQILHLAINAKVRLFFYASEWVCYAPEFDTYRAEHLQEECLALTGLGYPHLTWIGGQQNDTMSVEITGWLFPSPELLQQLETQGGVTNGEAWVITNKLLSVTGTQESCPPDHLAATSVRLMVSNKQVTLEALRVPASQFATLLALGAGAPLPDHDEKWATLINHAQHSELLNTLRDACHQLWANYDPGDLSSAPTNEQVILWLRNRGVHLRAAQIMAQLLRPTTIRTGPRPPKPQR